MNICCITNKKYYKYNISIGKYKKLLIDIKKNTENNNFDYAFGEILTDNNVRMFFDIENIPRTKPKLIYEIIDKLIHFYNLPQNYTLTFNSKSKHDLSYHLYFPVRITRYLLIKLIFDFHFQTQNKFIKYFDLAVYQYEQSIRSPYSGKYYYKDFSIHNNYHYLINGSLYDTIVNYYKHLPYFKINFSYNLFADINVILNYERMFNKYMINYDFIIDIGLNNNLINDDNNKIIIANKIKFDFYKLFFNKNCSFDYYDNFDNLLSNMNSEKEINENSLINEIDDDKENSKIIKKREIRRSINYKRIPIDHFIDCNNYGDNDNIIIPSKIDKDKMIKLNQSCLNDLADLYSEISLLIDNYNKLTNNSSEIINDDFDDNNFIVNDGHIIQKYNIGRRKIKGISNYLLKHKKPFLGQIKSKDEKNYYYLYDLLINPYLKNKELREIVKYNYKKISIYASNTKKKILPTIIKNSLEIKANKKIQQENIFCQQSYHYKHMIINNILLSKMNFNLNKLLFNNSILSFVDINCRNVVIDHSTLTNININSNFCKIFYCNLKNIKINSINVCIVFSDHKTLENILNDNTNLQICNVKNLYLYSCVMQLHKMGILKKLKNKFSFVNIEFCDKTIS